MDLTNIEFAGVPEYDKYEYCVLCGGLNQLADVHTHEGHVHECATKCTLCDHTNYWAYGHFQFDGKDTRVCISDGQVLQNDIDAETKERQTTIHHMFHYDDGSIEILSWIDPENSLNNFEDDVDKVFEY